MSSNVIETGGPARKSAPASWTLQRHPNASPETDESNRAFIEQRHRRRVQKKQFIDRAQRLLNGDPPPNPA